MNKPILVVMAAGMGSRYGGLKQIDPMNENGEILLDFSLYDAMRAGFERVVFVINDKNREDFNNIIDGGAGQMLDVDYAIQRVDDIPEEFKVPEGRIKPWGTCHAVLAARNLIDQPFAVINADDYYGLGAFESIYEFLKSVDCDKRPYQFAMVGYEIGKTLTKNGHVSRGVCSVSNCGYLNSITERTKVRWINGSPAYFDNVRGNAKAGLYVELPFDTTVSMNFWGFTPEFLREIESGFPAFLHEKLKTDPFECEYFLPSSVSSLIYEGRACVKVLSSIDKWYGVTYREDKEELMRALQAMKSRGEYPEKLWH